MKTAQFEYLDDAIYTGNRLLNDFRLWITGQAPPKSVVHAVTIASHSGGWQYAHGRIMQAAQQAGKSITLDGRAAIQLANSPAGAGLQRPGHRLARNQQTGAGQTAGAADAHAGTDVLAPGDGSEELLMAHHAGRRARMIRGGKSLRGLYIHPAETGYAGRRSSSEPGVTSSANSTPRAWEVRGTDRKTGEETMFIILAETENAAAYEASRRRMRVV